MRPVAFGWVNDYFGPIRRPHPVTKEMSLQEALATLSADLYYKIWKLYLSLETVDAEEQCKQDILNRMRAEATVRFPHEGSNTSHLFLLDAAMYVRYPYGLVLTNVTMPIAIANRHCHIGKDKTICMCAIHMVLSLPM